MADVGNNLEVKNNNETLEKLKRELNPLLEDFFIERKNKNTSHVKKEAFFQVFNTFTPEEKRAYRDYVYTLIKSENTQKNSLTDIINTLSNMDKLEVYAGICNNCKSDLSFDLPIPPANAFQVGEKNIPENFKTPDFTLSGGVIDYKGKKINLNSPELPKLNQFNAYGQYEFELDMYFPNIKQENSISGKVMGATPTKLILSHDGNGVFSIYDQDGIKETTAKAKNGKISFSIPRIQSKFLLDVGV